MNKVIIIGLDGATWKIIHKGIQLGKLERFKEKIQKGVHGTLLSTIPSITCPALPVMYTGKNPAKLGIFDFRNASGSIVSYDKIKSPVFWDLLGKKGHDCFIADLSITYPPKIAKGVMISGLLSPSEEKAYVYPESMKKELKDFHGLEYKELAGNIVKVSTFQDFFSITQHKFNNFKNLYKKYNYSFAFFWDSNVDRIQHFYWDKQKIIMQYHQNIEKMIFNFIDTNKNHNFLVVSDHGFEKIPTEIIYLNRWLQNEGYLKFSYNIKAKILQTYNKIRHYFGTWAYQNVHKKRYNKLFLLVTSFEKKLSMNNLNNEKIFLKNSETNKNILDVINTTAFVDQTWGIKIIKENLKEDYGEFREKLINKLKAYKNSENKHIFKEVLKKEEMFNGEYIEYVPDIIFQAEEGFEIKGGFSKSYSQSTNIKRIKGEHFNDRKGIFLAFGPDIKEGIKIKDVQIYDIAPTILHMYDTPIPKDVDGRVLMEIFKDDSALAKRKIKYSDTQNLNILNKCTKEIKI